MLKWILLAPLLMLAYVSFVASTWQLVIWILPIGEKAVSDFVKHCGTGDDRFWYLFWFYPISAPFQFMWAIRLRTDSWRQRRALGEERKNELLDIEHQTRLKELRAAEKEVDQYINGKP